MSEQSPPQSPESLPRRVWRSIRREPMWPQDDRGRLRIAVNDFILHLHPPRVPEKALKFTYTYGLGGLSILLLVILIGTGVLLMFNYTPSPEEAYTSIVALQTQVAFGQLIRNLHHWSGNLMIVVVFLHMLRVFFTGAYRPPREFNWVLGLLLLVLVALANFTGYLLPWDQLSYWAVTVMSGLIDTIPLIGEGLRELLLGGSEVGAVTLRNFYGLHVMLIPLGLFFVTSFHIWRVRKDKGSTERPVDAAYTDPDAPEGPRERVKMVTTIPHLVSIELVFALIVIALMLSWTLTVDAPLLEAANPNHPPDPTKAAWYFMGLQELLLHFHPSIAAVVIPGLLALGLLYLPYAQADPHHDYTGIWFRSRRGRRLTLLSTLLGVGITAGLVILGEGGDFASLMPGVDPLLSNGWIPLGVILFALWGYVRLIRRGGATRSETRLALFTLLLTAFITLTVIGNLFRGPGWALMLPWEVLA